MSNFTRISLFGFGVWITLSVLPAWAQGVYQAGDASVNSGWSATAPEMGSSGIAGTSTSIAGGNMVMSNLKSQGAMSAGRDVRCTACQIEGNVAAGHDIHLEHSPQVGSVSAGHDVTLLDSHVWGSLSAGHGAFLFKSTVQGNLSTGQQADMQDSTVEGSLSQGGHSLKLDASSVYQDIYFRGGQLQSVISGQGASIITQNGASLVRVGAHSLSRVNGYTVQGAAQQTTVITPQQAIYVNGYKVSGDGPKTYAQYRDAFPLAPVVEGPGWTEGNQSVASAHSNQSASKSLINILELSNKSLVKGQVVFESGYGKVILHPGSQIVGQVINGCVEKVAQ